MDLLSLDISLSLSLSLLLLHTHVEKGKSVRGKGLKWSATTFLSATFYEEINAKICESGLRRDVYLTGTRGSESFRSIFRCTDSLSLFHFWFFVLPRGEKQRPKNTAATTKKNVNNNNSPSIRVHLGEDIGSAITANGMISDLSPALNFFFCVLILAVIICFADQLEKKKTVAVLLIQYADT